MTARLAGALLLGLCLPAVPSLAASTDDMLATCRTEAARQLGIPAPLIDLRYEGRLADGSYAFEGDAETRPPMMFECSIERQTPPATHADAGCRTNAGEAARQSSPACD